MEVCGGWLTRERTLIVVPVVTACMYTPSRLENFTIMQDPAFRLVTPWFTIEVSALGVKTLGYLVISLVRSALFGHSVVLL